MDSSVTVFSSQGTKVSLLICYSYHFQCFTANDLADPKQNCKVVNIGFKHPSFLYTLPIFSGKTGLYSVPKMLT